jgi:hypothetical protein
MLFGDITAAPSEDHTKRNKHTVWAKCIISLMLKQMVHTLTTNVRSTLRACAAAQRLSHSSARVSPPPTLIGLVYSQK